MKSCLCSCIAVLSVLLGTSAFCAEGSEVTMSGLRVNQPPRIDGRFHDWDLSQAKTINGATCRKMGLNDGVIEGDADSSATLAIAWDETHLYLAASIRDDRLHRLSKATNSPWACDSLLLNLHSTEAAKKTGRFEDKSSSKYGKTPFIALAMAHPEESTYFLPEGSRCVTLPGEKGWHVEAAIPLKAMGYELKAGDALHLSAILVDSDPGKLTAWGQRLWNMLDRKLAKGEHVSRQWGRLVLQGTVVPAPEKLPALSRTIKDASAKKLPPERWLPCRQRPAKVTLDGKLDEWNLAQGFFINPDAAKALGRIDGKVDHDQDASAEVVLAWDKEYLYLAAMVTDDRYEVPYDFSKPWTCDTIMLQLRSTEDGRATGRYKDQVTYGSGKHPVLAFTYTDEATRNRFLPKGSESIAVPIEHGWTVEARVPLSALGWEIQPNDVIRMGVIHVDADYTVHGSKWGQLCWMWSSTPQHDDEDDWGAVRFVKERNNAAGK
jgi:hypothetical protein